MTTPDPMGASRPTSQDVAEAKQRFVESMKAATDRRTATERHAEAVQHGTAHGGFTDWSDYEEALNLKRRGRADQATLAKLENTDAAGLSALVNRPG